MHFSSPFCLISRVWDEGKFLFCNYSLSLYIYPTLFSPVFSFAYVLAASSPR